MILTGREKLTEFVKKHAITRSWIASWIAEVAVAKWMTSMDIKLRYSSASFLASNVVIFNVKGNDYRLETQVLYATDESPGTVNVRWVGPHAEYSKGKR